MKLLLARLLYWVKGLFEDPVELFKALGVESSDKILEVGCAVGYHTIPLVRIASEGKVYAVDVWEQALAHLEHEAASVDNIEVICRSADALEFPSTSLDKVVCFDTLHELPDPEQALGKWVTFLKQSGRLLYRDPSIPSDRIGTLSNGRLLHSETIQGVDIFIRRGADQGIRTDEPG